MSKRAFEYLFPIFAVVLGLSPRAAEAKRVDGVFTTVEEADLVVLDYGDGSYAVRLFGVAPPAAGQPFAAEAKQFVSERLLGLPGAMRFRYRTPDGEMVSRIYYRGAGQSTASERDLALDLVAAGLAWVRPGAKYKPDQRGMVDRLTAALAEAKAARRGIWSLANPVEPWTFRGEKAPREVDPTGMSLGVSGNPDINVSKQNGDNNECAIAKNPNNPLQLAVHCNTPDDPWRSTDGGQTWQAGGAIGSYCCDPNLAWDSFGNLYATYINGGVDAIITKLSTDGGATWSDLASFGGGGVDQPSVVATDLPDDGEGNPQVALWIVLNQGGMKARGALVTGLGVANVGAFGPLQTINTGGSCSFGDLTVSPTGVVIQVCGPQTGQNGGNVVINVDADGLGPNGFGSAIVPTTTNVGGFDVIPAQANRTIDSETGVAYDRNPASPTYGRLYLLYTDEVVNENNDTEIFVRHSDNDGATWSAPTRVNSDATTRSQFLPKIATDPLTGNVAICWHDARNSASNTAMEVYCDRTAPGVYPTFIGNIPVSDGASTSNGAGVEFGDYCGLALTGNVAHPVWADTSNSTGDNPQGNSGFDTYVDYFSVLAADYTLGVSSASQTVCAPADAEYQINVGAFGGFDDDVTLGVSGNPAGTTANFSVNPVTPPNSSVLTIGNTGAATPGPATLSVSASSTTGPKSLQLSLSISNGDPAQPALTSPANGAVDVAVLPALSWAAAAGATSYLVEISDDVTFATVDYSATVAGTSHPVATPLTPQTLYYWRVTAENACGETVSGARSFTTANIIAACSGAITIPDSGSASPYPAVAHVGVGAGNALSVEVELVGLTHTYMDDVDMLLVSPGGQKFIFLSDVGGSNGVSAVNVTASDAAATLLPDSGAIATGSYRPSNVDAGDSFPAPAPATPYVSATPAGSGTFLGTFAPSAVPGDWKLYVRDDAGGDSGSIAQFCIRVQLGNGLPFIDSFESNDTSRWSTHFP